VGLAVIYLAVRLCPLYGKLGGHPSYREVRRLRGVRRNSRAHAVWGNSRGWKEMISIASGVTYEEVDFGKESEGLLSSSSKVDRRPRVRVSQRGRAVVEASRGFNGIKGLLVLTCQDGEGVKVSTGGIVLRAFTGFLNRKGGMRTFVFCLRKKDAPSKPRRPLESLQGI